MISNYSNYELWLVLKTLRCEDNFHFIDHHSGKHFPPASFVKKRKKRNGGRLDITASNVWHLSYKSQYHHSFATSRLLHGISERKCWGSILEMEVKFCGHFFVRQHPNWSILDTFLLWLRSTFPFQNIKKKSCQNPLWNTEPLSLSLSYIRSNCFRLNKNYYVVRNAGWAHTRNTWKWTLIFYQLMN